jgi:N-acetylneuraminic acid mutarotase
MVDRRSMFASVVALGAASCNSGPPYDFTALQPYPCGQAPHVEGTRVVLSGKVWLLGGTPGSVSNGCNCGSQATTSVDIYDPTTDTWTSGPPTNHARYFCPMAFVVGDTVYYFGGSNNEKSPPPVEALAPPYSAWVDIPNSHKPAEILGHRIGDVINGQIVAASVGSNNTATILSFDPSTSAWSTHATSSFPVGDYACGAASGSKLYVVTGLSTTSFTVTASVYAYDMATDTWVTAAALPKGQDIVEAGITVLNGNLLVFGGDNDGTAMLSFDPSNNEVNRWENALIESRSDLVAATSGANAYTGVTRRD